MTSMTDRKPATTARSRKAAQAAQTSGSAIIAALEAAYADVRAIHPDLPAVVFITGTGLMGRGAKWGHYWRDAWVAGPAPKAAPKGTATTLAADDHGGTITFSEGRLPEIFIAGERLACGAEDTLETILHEAAHALAVVRQIKDTSRDGRYHNRRYLALAEELGLEFADETPHPVIGFSNTALTAEAKKTYKATIRNLAKAIKAYMDTFQRLGLTSGQGGEGMAKGGDAPTKVPGKGGAKAPNRNYLKASCGCGRIIRASRPTLEAAPITCGECGEPFTAEEA